MRLTSRAFWAYSAERAVKTAAQSAAALLSVGYAGLLDVDWAGVASASGLAALLSLLTSLQKCAPGPLRRPRTAQKPEPNR